MDFLSDYEAMSDYQIIIVESGVDSSDDATTQENLQQFVFAPFELLIGQ